jgi:hypothetical protein
MPLRTETRLKISVKKLNCIARSIYITTVQPLLCDLPASRNVMTERNDTTGARTKNFFQVVRSCYHVCNKYLLYWPSV